MKKSCYLLLANYLYMTGIGLLSPIYALYVLDIGGSALTAGASWSVYLITAGVLMMIFGNIQDKSHNVKGYIVLGYSVAANKYVALSSDRHNGTTFCTAVFARHRYRATNSGTKSCLHKSSKQKKTSSRMVII